MAQGGFRDRGIPRLSDVDMDATQADVSCEPSCIEKPGPGIPGMGVATPCIL
jgi:hypothetical protein